ncbi:nitrate/nitrite sensor protein NarX [mine drainage metagenome]|uniref:histidine kinase n=1 Tax=mine drainage metagenome TaxID=410659 RepID=A0A1J5RKX4_9ZZZZ
MQNILSISKLIRVFVKKHKLYASLHTLVISMILSVILMQAGSLFLFDYIPDHLSIIHHAYQDQSLWKLEVYKLKNNLNESSSDFNLLNENQSAFDDSAYIWAKNQNDTSLARAYKKLESAHHNFADARVHSLSKEVILERGQLVISAYDEFISAAEKDVVIKQSVVSLLQLVCLFLVFCIGAGIMLTSWSILILRLGKVFSMMPSDLVSNMNSQQYDDEFEMLEKSTAELSARLEGIQVETKWVNITSTEKMRKMILAQDFMFKLAKLIGDSGLSELTIKKSLYSLERTLGVGNVALVFSENGSRISAQRALFSSYWPLSFDESMFDETVNSVAVSHTTKLIHGECVQCVTVPLLSPSGWLGILLLETEANHYFEGAELQLFEVTAQMLALSMGFQAREQESRRVALLEERAVIARELHDSLAQSLSYMKFQLARLQTNFGSNLIESGAVTIVDDMRDGLDNAYRELRELLTTFRVQMDIRGLDHVLEEAIEEFSQRSSLNIMLDNRLQECRLSVNEEFHLLHVVREALSNIVRHSGAEKVTIALVLQSTGDVIVTIDDDGKGCSFDEAKPHHYGLAIMTERAYCLGGTIEVIPRRLGGTRVRLLFRPK